MSSSDNPNQNSPAQPSVTPRRRTSTTARRDVLRYTGAAVLTAGSGGLLAETLQAAAAAAAADATTTGAAAAAQTAGTFTPLRPPATPLAVRSPYLSTWLAGDNLAGTWPSFWNGHVTAICGIARIDGVAYLFAGAPSSSIVPNVMTQTSLQLTATRSIFTFTAAGVTLTVTFLSPVDLGNLKRQCVPFSYVTIQASASDGKAHAVDVHLDISSEWTHGDITQQVTWTKHQTSGGSVALTFTPATPSVLAEHADQASWGTSVLVAANAGGLTWQMGQDVVVRGLSASTGRLADTIDQNQPRAIENNWPCAALNHDFGTITSAAVSPAFVAGIGHVRTPAVSYLGTDLPPWWTTYWSSWQDMADWFLGDYTSALSSAVAFDAQIESAASAVGGGTVGASYSALCALAARQAVGGTELVSRNGTPWAFLKEISSSGNVSTVDVVYPAFPGYLYLSPAYLQMLLEPLFDYAENGGWPQPFAQHDLGQSYPNAAGGIVNGQDIQEDMPVEETANMLVMTAALLQRLTPAQAAAFASSHYPQLKKWADYLVSYALDPANQNQTDDFTGWIAHSANLALKGIVGIGAMSLIAGFNGNTTDQASYYSTARSYISQWVSKGEDPSGECLDLAYGAANTWSLKYNGFPDSLLGLNLVPTGIKAQEANWYQRNAGTYGVLLDPRNDYTKADWEIWTAAWLSDQGSIRNTMIDGVYGFANTTANRVPFSDWYVVATAAQVRFQNRPVAGAMFAPALTPAADRTRWYRIQNQHSGKVLAVSNQSLGDSANVTQWTDNGTSDHLWAIIPNPDGTVRIMNRHSAKVLAVHSQSLTDGAYVQQYQDNGTPDHLWRIVSAGNGWNKIVNVHSGKVMAVSNQSTADGAQVTQWDDNGTPDHLWKLL